MEQLVILVLIGLISLINWIVQKSGEARARRKLEREEPEKQEHLTMSEQPAPVETRGSFDKPQAGGSMRQLMEALGVELSEAETRPTPPPPLPHPVAHPVPDIPSRPSLVEEARRLEDRAALQKPLPRELSARERARIVPPRRQPQTRMPKKIPTRVQRVGDLLATPSGLRNGILLAEILGPPKALRKEL